MANKVIICASNSSSAQAIALENVILSLGYTVVIIESASITVSLVAAQASGGHVICAVCVIAHLESDELGVKLLNISNAGYPIIIGVAQNVSGTGSITNALGLTTGGYVEIDSAGTNIYVVIDNDILINSGGITNGSIINYRSENTYISYLLEVGLHTSVKKLGLNSDVSGKNILSYVNKNSLTHKISSTAATIVFAGFLWSTSYTAQGKLLIGDLINFCVKNTYTKFQVSGFVFDNEDTPLQRTLRAYRRSDGVFLAQTQSDSYGKYTFTLSAGDAVSVICFSGESETKNALIKDKIVPVEL